MFSKTCRFFFLYFLTAVIVSGCSPSDIFSDASLPELKSLESISIETSDDSCPGAFFLAPGTRIYLRAVGHFNDKSSADITSVVSWDVTKKNVAVMEEHALVASETGTTRVTACLGSISAEKEVTVTDGVLTAIEISPGNAILPVGMKKKFQAVGTFSGSNGDTIQDITGEVTWKSSDTGCAEFFDTGVVSAILPGEVTLRAGMGEVKGETLLTVKDVTLTSIEITPYSITLPLGAKEEITATGILSDGTTMDISDQVTWSLSDVNRAEIFSSGGSYFLDGTGKGSATVFAAMINSLGETVTGIASVEVTEAVLMTIDLTVSESSIPLGLTGSATATGIYSNGVVRDITESASWTSSNESRAAVSSLAGSRGRISAMGAGDVTITAMSGEVTASAGIIITEEVLLSIEVTPSLLAVPRGLKQQMKATGTYSNSVRDITSLVTWSSLQPDFAAVSNSEESRGEVTALSQGPAEITASIHGVTGNTTLTVVQEELLSIEITPGNSSILPDLEKPFTATGNFTDGSRDITTSVSWTSSDSAIALVSNEQGKNGVVSARMVGTTEIYASLGEVSSCTSLTVTGSPVTEIQIMVYDATVYTGCQGKCEALALCADGSIHDVTEMSLWSLSDTSSAAISNTSGSRGIITGTKDGGSSNIQVTATFNEISGMGDVTIIGLEYLFFTSEAPYNGEDYRWLNEDEDWQYMASARYADGTENDISGKATWRANGHVGYYPDADAWCDTVTPGMVHAENETSGWSDEIIISVEFAGKSVESTLWVW